jgi:hypothetical protein
VHSKVSADTEVKIKIIPLPRSDAQSSTLYPVTSLIKISKFILD